MNKTIFLLNFTNQNINSINSNLFDVLLINIDDLSDEHNVKFVSKKIIHNIMKKYDEILNSNSHALLVFFTHKQLNIKSICENFNNYPIIFFHDHSITLNSNNSGYSNFYKLQTFLNKSHALKITKKILLNKNIFDVYGIDDSVLFFNRNKSVLKIKNKISLNKIRSKVKHINKTIEIVDKHKWIKVTNEYYRLFKFFLYPLVSIRIPLYNHEKYILNLLNSILIDNYPRKEILINDDFSSDNSLNLVKNFINCANINFPIKLFHEKKNNGVCHSINKLVNECSGDIILGIASDDELVPNSILPRVKKLLSSDKLALITDCEVIDENGIKLYSSSIIDLYKNNYIKYSTDKLLAKNIILNWGIAGPSLIVKREIYSLTGLYDENDVLEDWSFYIKLISLNTLFFAPIMGAKYRIHPKNTSQSSKKNQVLFSQIMTAYKNIFSFKFDLNFEYSHSNKYSIRFYFVVRFIRLFMKYVILNGKKYFN